MGLRSRWDSWWGEGPPPAGSDSELVDGESPLENEDGNESELPGAGGREGLRTVTKALDTWFAIEVSRLEKEAHDAAASWAQAGLPRLDAAVEGELPAESALGLRASEIFAQWVQKVSVRVQDAIEAHFGRAREAIREMEYLLKDSRRTSDEIIEVERQIAAAEAAVDGREVSFAFRGYWPLWGYFLLIGLLVIVDWVANVPVFQELLPQDAATGGGWALLAAEAETHGSLSGLYLNWYRILFAPEVALLALGVIVFLMVLAHILGASLRRMVALNDDDIPGGERSAARYRRQFWFPALAGLVGGAAVVFFLFQARNEIREFAVPRHEAAVAQIEELDSLIVIATEEGDMNEVARLSASRPALEDELATREERLSYSQRIAATNVPITILNSVLFLVAALLAYLKTHDTVAASDLTHPRIAEFRSRRRELQETLNRNRSRLGEADVTADHALAATEYLAASRPFDDWEGRRNRLSRIVPIFRSENVRLRGIDPHNVLAFRGVPTSRIEMPNVHDRLRLPAEFEEVQRTHEALSREARAFVGAAEVARHD